jgi:hypothetical protein
MNFDDQEMYKQYLVSRRLNHNLISESKCCLECGKFMSKSEIGSMLLEQADTQDEDLDHEKFVEREMPKAGKKPNGYVIYEGSNKYGKYACVATGVINTSSNIKTGPMIQIFMITPDIHPVEAIKSGENAIVCWHCKHKPATEAEKAKGIKGGACYVDVTKSVAQVYKAYQRGCYPNICSGNIPERNDMESYLQRGSGIIREIFSGRKVRFGAYGEPVLIPFPIVKLIAGVASGHTGYTHRWQESVFLNSGYKNFFMASVDSESEYDLAEKNGWRSFRVVTEWKLKQNEMICLNSWQEKTCFDCLQCNGASGNRRSIVIKVHGKSKSRFKDDTASKDMATNVVSNFGEEGDTTVSYNAAEDQNAEQTKAIMSGGHSKSQMKQIEIADEIEDREAEAKRQRRAQGAQKRKVQKQYMGRNIYQNPATLDQKKYKGSKNRKIKSKDIASNLGAGDLDF